MRSEEGKDSMTLINTEGLALIGPGSEWFWSMLQLVVVLVSLVGLYRQLKLQTSASAFEQLRAIVNDWGSERLLRCRVELLRALRDGTHAADLPPGVGVILLDYFETVGLLIRNGHVSRELVWETFGNVCQSWWVTMKPYLMRIREVEADSKIGEHFEWLASEMATLEAKLPNPTVIDDAYIARTLDEKLATAVESLRIVRSLRAPVKSAS
jgi:hypothetical protein